jgi:hypothetical protein
VGALPAPRREFPVEDLDGQPAVHGMERAQESDISPHDPRRIYVTLCV